LRETYSLEGHGIIGDIKVPARVTVVPRLKDDLVATTVLLAENVPYCVPVRVGKMVGWDMVWVMLQEIDSELSFISMEHCCLDADSRLVQFLRYPSIIGSSEIW